MSLEIGRKIAEGGILLTLRDIVANTVIIVSSIYVARAIGPVDYGKAAAALTLATLIVYVAGLSLGKAIIKFVAANINNERKSSYVYTSIAIITLSSSLAGFMLYMLADSLTRTIGKPNIVQAVRFLSLYIVLFSLIDVSDAILQGLHCYKKAALAYVIRAFFRATIIPLLVLCGYGYMAIIIGLVLSQAVGFFVFFYFILASVRPVTVSRLALIDLIHYSFPLYVSGLVSALGSQGLQTYLVSRVSYSDMGYLAVAMFLQTPVLLLTNGFLQAGFSVLSSISSGLKEIVGKLTYYINLILQPLIMFLASSSSLLILLLYGDKYAPSAIYVVLLMFSFIPNVIGAFAYTIYANIIGNTHFTGRITIIDVVLRFALYVPLIEIGGVIGFLIANISANTLVGIVTLLLGRKKFGFTPPLKQNVKILFPVLSSYLISLAASSTCVSLGYIIEPIVYIIILSILLPRTIKREDIELLASLAKGTPIIGWIVSTSLKLLIRLLW